MRLLQKEFDLLAKIANETKMSCWFSLRIGKDGKIYVYDLEERKRISLRNGVKILLEGIADTGFLTIEEKEVLEILKREILRWIIEIC